MKTKSTSSLILIGSSKNIIEMRGMNVVLETKVLSIDTNQLEMNYSTTELGRILLIKSPQDQNKKSMQLTKKDKWVKKLIIVETLTNFIVKEMLRRISIEK